MSTPHAVLCIGHSRLKRGRIEGGAVSVGRVNEWTYNTGLAPLIVDQLRKYRLRAEIIDRYEGAGYDTAQRLLAARLRNIGPACALELHFNSAGKLARGHEHLHHPRSSGGKRLAECLSAEQCLATPEILCRGPKPRWKGNGVANRGWQFLYYPPMPSVIVEPGFGSNEDDWRILSEKRERVASAIAEGIASWLD